MSQVTLVRGNAKITRKDNAVFEWRDPEKRRYKLTFAALYELSSATIGEGVRDCAYKVGSRKFTDLSFLKGEMIKEIFSGGAYALSLVRRRPDGAKVLSIYEEIPTFDSDDREWDGTAYTCLYRDGREVNLLYCRYGYSIPRIDIYLGLKETAPDFSSWLDLLAGDKENK